MKYEDYKREVLSFFAEYIFTYLIPDIERLVQLEPHENGLGGCAIPQAITCFAAADLFGYLIDPQNRGVQKPCIQYFLNTKYLKGIFDNIGEVDKKDFLDLIRDEIRNSIIHRFFLVNFHIAKIKTQDKLIVKEGVNRIFNVDFFSRQIILSITEIQSLITNDLLKEPASATPAETLERVYNRLQKLKEYKTTSYNELMNSSSSYTTTQTTSSLG